MNDDDPQIDKFIAMPEKGTRGRGKIQRFIRTLVVGDSFVTSQSQAIVYQTAIKKAGGKATTRWTGKYERDRAYPAPPSSSAYNSGNQRMYRVWLIEEIFHD